MEKTYKNNDNIVDGLNVTKDIFVQKIVKSLILSGQSDELINKFVKDYILNDKDNRAMVVH